MREGESERLVRRFKDVFVYDLFSCFLCATFFFTQVVGGGGVTLF
jgi:hypothetical protein